MAKLTMDEATASSMGSEKHDGVLVGEIVPLVFFTAAAQEKKPPPEAPESIRLRMSVIASFWAIVVFLGLPIWWKTTLVYRASLPLKQMNNWAEGQVSLQPLGIWLYRLSSTDMPTRVPSPYIH